MALITRTYTFTDGTTAYGSQVDSEVANIVTTLNNLNAASATWDIVKAVNGASVPLIADNSSGTNNIFEARANNVAKVVVGAAGLLTAAAGLTVSGASLTMSGQTVAMGSNKITGLANGTAATDAMAFGQNHVFQVVGATSGTPFTTGLTAFQKTNLAVTITPTSASSKILVLAAFMVNNNTTETSYIDLFRGNSTVSGQTNGLVNSYGTADSPCTVIYLDSPNTTSATTYTVGLRVSNGTGAVGNSNQGQVIVAIEVQ